eukprot:15437110-Alexandrium_andersonii.AAC.1
MWRSDQARGAEVPKSSRQRSHLLIHRTRLPFRAALMHAQRLACTTASGSLYLARYRLICND